MCLTRKRVVCAWRRCARAGPRIDCPAARLRGRRRAVGEGDDLPTERRSCGRLCALRGRLNRRLERSMTFDHLSSHALTARLGELVATERRTIADFVLHLAELERRKLHLELGYSSTFSFCTQFLKLTNASAYRRTVAARLAARYSSIANMLA